MFRTLKLASAIAALSGFAPSAIAAITIDTTISGVTLDFNPGAPLPDKIKGNGAPSGTVLPLITDSNHLIDFIAPNTLEQNGGSGFATVSGLGNGRSEQGFSSLTIDPQNPVNGFSRINFNLEPLGSGRFTYFGDIRLNLFSGASPIVFQNVAFGNGQNRFGIFSNDNRLFQSVLFSNLHQLENDSSRAINFDSIRQVSIQLAPSTPAVPEPSTWMMMLLGFGAIGFGLRRRKISDLVPSHG
jgi:hypothetical protein